MTGGCPFSGAASTAGRAEQTEETRGRVSRRGLFGGAVGAAVASTAVAVAAGGVAHADDGSAGPTTQHNDTGRSAYPFEGVHQNGILTSAQRISAHVAFDVTAADRAALQELLKTITSQARQLTVGGTPYDQGLVATDADNGVLGPDVPADGLTVTASVGASLFDHRYGLADVKPARLRQMDEFPNDALDRATCDGDLLLQICAHNSDTVLHALRQITRVTRGAMQVRWRRDGFISPPRPSGTPRNMLGFKDGTANPTTTDAALMDKLVWTHGGQGGEPAWVEGGTYHVVRLIRMFVEFWDRVSLREQQNIFGRDKATGAPLTGSREFDAPNYVTDSTQDVILSNAHIRLANPRTDATTEAQRIVRRSYNYDLGMDSNGNLDMGHLFVAFNQDLDRQFVTIQKRLIDEPLVDYVSPTGGGYFFALPGVQGSSDWLGRGMFA